MHNIDEKFFHLLKNGYMPYLAHMRRSAISFIEQERYENFIDLVGPFGPIGRALLAEKYGLNPSTVYSWSLLPQTISNAFALRISKYLLSIIKRIKNEY